MVVYLIGKKVANEKRKDHLSVLFLNISVCYESSAFPLLKEKGGTNLSWKILVIKFYQRNLLAIAKIVRR